MSIGFRHPIDAVGDLNDLLHMLDCERVDEHHIGQFGFLSREIDPPRRRRAAALSDFLDHFGHVDGIRAVKAHLLLDLFFGHEIQREPVAPPWDRSSFQFPPSHESLARGPMIWGPYEFVSEVDRSVKFRRIER